MRTHRFRDQVVRRVGYQQRFELRSVLLAGTELATDPEPSHLYARHLVGCLDDAALDNVLRLAGMGLRRGTSLFLELAADPSLPQAHRLVRRTDNGLK